MQSGLHGRLPVLLLTGHADLADQSANDLPRLSGPYRQVKLADRVTKLPTPADAPGAERDRPVTLLQTNC